MTDTPMDPNEAAARAMQQYFDERATGQVSDREVVKIIVRARDKALATNLPPHVVEAAGRASNSAWNDLGDTWRAINRAKMKHILSAAFQALGEGGE